MYIIPLCFVAILISLAIVATSAVIKWSPVALSGEPDTRERWQSQQVIEARRKSAGETMGEGILVVLIGVGGWASLAVFIAILDASAHVQTLRNIALPSVSEPPRTPPPPLQHLVQSKPRPSDAFLEPGALNPPAKVAKPAATLPTQMSAPAAMMLDLDALDQATADAIAKRKP